MGLFKRYFGQCNDTRSGQFSDRHFQRDVYPLLPLFVATLPGGSAAFLGLIEGAAERFPHYVSDDDRDPDCNFGNVVTEFIGIATSLELFQAFALCRRPDLRGLRLADRGEG